MLSFLGNLVLVVLSGTVVKSTLTELWCTEHIEDIIESDAYRKNIPALTPAVVGLYDTQCKNRLYNEFGFTDRGLPNVLHLLVASYDRKMAHSQPWYEFEDSRDDVFTYLGVDTTDRPESEWCPTVVFRPANWSLPNVIYNPSIDGTNVVQWVWQQLRTQVTFKYGLESDETVSLFVERGAANNADIRIQTLLGVLEPTQTDSETVSQITVDVYASEVIIAQVLRDGEPMDINRFIIDSIVTDVTVTEPNQPIDSIDQFNQKQLKELQMREAQNWSTRRRYLSNIKAPPIMPNFTDLGYKKQPLPADVCEYVTQFWEERKDSVRAESFPRDGTQINAREIGTYMAHIPGDKKRWIASRIQPYLEEWTNTPLTYSTMYGAREYRTGAVLKGHVDRIETHIVSTIIHVAHDYRLENGTIGEPWTLELFGWDGKRVYVQDDVCDMVFYESSKLIHGRPATYSGRSWVNAFLHFRPANWDAQGYRFTPQNELITPETSLNLVDFIYG